MVTIEYKILFEVRLLHDYYLADPTGKSFFSLDENAKTTLLEEKLKKGRYDVHTDFELLLSKTDQLFFKNHKLKLVKTMLGFFVGIKVDAHQSAGGKLAYLPVVPPTENARMMIGLGLKNQLFSNISNLPILLDPGELFYFTNIGEKKDNILSRPIAKMEDGQEYNMGDLSKRGNFIYSALKKNNGQPEFWQRISGNGYVHQADRSLLGQEPWFRDWLLDLGTIPVVPFALLGINLRSENPGLSPIKENGYLSTELLPSQKRPRHPIYELRFLGRSTYWRYRKADGFNSAERSLIEDHAGNLLTYENGNYITKAPYFLAAEMPYLNSDGFRLPSAKPYPLKFENEKLYSDIYFNGINPIPNGV
ncbi:MAG TPA: hypothetical protein VK014_04035 [Cyclobacteriaceae bacterium]|nr:hypothetical protein [Cyclobacteriaceae bacterium]